MDLDANGFLLRALQFGELVAQTSTSAMQIKYSDTPVEMYSKIVSDFSHTTLPMISGVSLRLEFSLQEPSFYILCPDTNGADKAYKLRILNANLAVPVLVMASGLSLDLERKLSSTPITFGLSRLETKKVLIPAGGQSFTSDSLFQSSINPNRLFMVLVSSNSWDSGYKTNPLCFEHTIKNVSGNDAELTRAMLTINGQPLNQDAMGTGRKMRMTAFRAMYKALGSLDKRDDCCISWPNFEGGYFLLFWDMTASGRAASGPMAKQPPRQGHVRLELNFSNPLPMSVYLFIFAEYDASVTVDKNRNVKYSFVA